MRQAKKFCTVLIAVFSFYASHGQLLEIPNLELITEKEGLPFNSIQDIISDDKGFLWVAGINNLARYDGYSFLEIPWENDSTRSIAGSIITSVTKDAQGMFWIGCMKGRAFKFNPYTLETITFQVSEESSPSLSTKVFADRSGNVWLFIEGIGLYKFNETKFDFIGALGNLPQNGLAKPNFYNRLSGFLEESPELIWLATSNGMYQLKTKTLEIKHISSMSDDVNRPAFLHQIVPDGNGGLWCSSYGTGLLHFNPKTGVYQSYLFELGSPGTANIVYGIVRKNNHELWISSNGLGVFNEVTKKFSFYNDRNDLNTTIASFSMINGNDGIVWVITDKGLLKCAPSQNNFSFTRLKVKQTDNRGYYGVNEILIDKPTGRKIIASAYADGLHVFDSLGNETILSINIHSKAEPYRIVHDLLKDRDGKILVLTRDQLYELTTDNRLIKIIGPNELLPINTVPYFFRILQSASGDYWIASTRNGLFHFDKKKNQWRIFTEEVPNTLASNRAFRLEEDANHLIWVAHPLHGLSIFDPQTEKWTYMKHTEGDSTGLVSNVFTDFTQSQQGKMIFSTLEGISVIDPSTRSIKNLNKRNSFNWSVYSAASDTTGNIWAVTNRGLLVLNGKGKVVHQFNARDGLKGVYASFQLRPSGDQMTIYTFQGFYSFYPEKTLQEIKNTAPLYITGVNNQNIDLAGFAAPKEIRISHTANTLSVAFSLLNFSGTNRNGYRYKMEGLDENWIETFSNQVNYSGMPSGNFVFKVQSLSGGAEASMAVFVSTPFWKQAWFRVLLAAGVLILVYFLLRFRLNQIRQEEKMKREFNKRLADVEMKALRAQMSPHFIFNSLNSINRYIVKSEPEKASLYLTKFSKLIRLILDNSNSKVISLEQELISLKLYIELEALRFNDKFTYTLNVNTELSPLSIGVPPMIIQPFIENAIWHGLLHKETPGRLTISINRFGHGLQCIIEDDGIGRKKAAELKSKSVNREKSYGMKITTDRLNMLNGESKISNIEIIDLEDEAGNATGTKVIVKIMSAELEPEF